MECAVRGLQQLPNSLSLATQARFGPNSFSSNEVAQLQRHPCRVRAAKCESSSSGFQSVQICKQRSKCRSNRAVDDAALHSSLGRPMQRSARPGKNQPQAMGRDGVKEKEQDIELAVRDTAPSRSSTNVNRNETENDASTSEIDQLLESGDGKSEKAARRSVYARLWSNVNGGTLKHEPGSLIGAILLVAGTTVRIGSSPLKKRVLIGRDYNSGRKEPWQSCGWLL